MSFSPKATSIGVVTPSTSLSSSATPSSWRRPSCSAFDAGEVFLGAGLDLGRGVLVEALDVGDFLGLHIGEFLDRAEAFGREELAHHLVHVEGVHEELGAGREFLLAALRLLGLGEDVDVPAGELRGQAHVLAAAADGEGELVVGNHHLDAVGLLVEHHLHDFGGLERVHDEGGLIDRPGDDVDLLALQFAHHRLDAGAAHADAGADGVDGGIARGHGDLGAEPGSRATAFTSTMPS
jgi:hypothetical protein